MFEMHPYTSDENMNSQRIMHTDKRLLVAGNLVHACLHSQYTRSLDFWQAVKAIILKIQGDTHFYFGGYFETGVTFLTFHQS